jgi:hypothetical protein
MPWDESYYPGSMRKLPSEVRLGRRGLLSEYRQTIEIPNWYPRIKFEKHKRSNRAAPQ